jgi:HPr kinase/phosphorylase
VDVETHEPMSEPTDKPVATLAGTAIARHGFGVLITGASGAGKSDLALRAITGPLLLPNEATPATPFQLISDDQTVVTRANGALLASAPATIRNMLEVRGIGIIPVKAVSAVPLILVAEITHGPIDRMPEDRCAESALLGCKLEAVQISPFEASAPAKLALRLQAAALRLHDQRIAVTGGVV